MQQLEFVKATDLDEAWSNFDPQAPLPGEESPFYVPRPGEPLGRLSRALLHTFITPPKFFFAGYRGSGKSTELNRLASNPDIQRKYVVVKFSIFDTCDVNNLDYRDVLLALGAQVFTQYTQRGGRLDPALLKELESWKGRVVTRLQERGAVFEGGAGIDLSKFFLSALLKVKTEHTTRQLIRQEIGPRLTELIEKINLIAAAVQAREKRPVLMIIDDLDKPSLEQAEAIFFRNFAAITQPACAIVYTVPAAILYSDVFMVSPIRENCYSLPNVKLHPQGCDEVAPEGYQTMREVALRRMDEALIEADALEEIVALSGGVFRELTFGLRAAISNAQSRGAERVELPDVDWARSQLRNPLLRLLSDEDMELLKWVRAENPLRFPDPVQNARLLHILAILQYADGPDWFDVHPALEEALT